VKLEDINQSIQEGARRFAAAQPRLDHLCRAADALGKALATLPASAELAARFCAMKEATERAERDAQFLVEQIAQHSRTVTIYDLPPELRQPKQRRHDLSSENWRRNGKKPGRRR
jgi:hypothetical protein